MKQISLKGQTAFITGASSGIGRACAEQFAQLGVNLVVVARRLERLNELQKALTQEHGINVFAHELDVQDNDAIQKLFAYLCDKKITIDIVVNNAGLALAVDKIQDADVKNWDVMIDTNVKGLLYVTRAALPAMIARDRGHIINIGSVAGHDAYPRGNVYAATKFAVRGISKSLRLDLAGTSLRVSEVDPGAVETEFSEVRFSSKEKAKQVYQGFDPLIADDIADAVTFCATRPAHVNIAEMIVYPQAQAAISHITRRDNDASFN